jgi:hypothetical protein
MNSLLVMSAAVRRGRELIKFRRAVRRQRLALGGGQRKFTDNRRSDLTQVEMTKAPEAVDPGAVDHVLVWARRIMTTSLRRPPQQVMFAPVARQRRGRFELLLRRAAGAIAAELSR